ncbi:hypothetical protein DRQ53_11225 [bacterium]|nr:MAG: hypothetical protein DRQ32_00015 [bacterium]RKZ14568.1 MAG: hypothetical protein DRQ53_11225 [bacterium]
MDLSYCSVEFRERVWPSLEEAARARLEHYWTDLLRYNRAQNLVSRREPELRVSALIEECVVAGGLLGAHGLRGRRWADVGSGGGIPGLVLAALDPGQELVLIERRQGRCDFLRREVRALELGLVRVFEGDVGVFDGDPFDVVLAKAVAPPGEIEGLCSPILAAGGSLVVFGRPEDAVADGWRLHWVDRLPAKDSVLRGLVRA